MNPYQSPTETESQQSSPDDCDFLIWFGLTVLLIEIALLKWIFE